MACAALFMAGHIYQHCLAADYQSLTECQVCKALASTSCNAAVVFSPEIAVAYSVPAQETVTAGVSPLALLHSRAPPSL